MQIFESHAHYDDEQFNGDREELLNKIHSSGVEKIVSAGYSLEGSKNGLELAKKYDYIYTTLGISPNDINENWEQEIAELDRILSVEFKNNTNNLNENSENTKSNINGNIVNGLENTECKINGNMVNDLKNNEKLNNYSNDGIKNKQNGKKYIVAIGEIGLDYHYSLEKDKQKAVFIKQIELANKYDLPIVIHTREAVMDTLQILKEHPVNQKGEFHCCPFNRELVKEALKLGFYISFSGTCTFKNAKNAEEIVKMVPDDKFLIETDSPYLAPEPVRGTRNDSRNLVYIIEKIAKFKNKEPAEIAEISYKNAARLFEI